MGLAKQVISIPTVAGVDTNTPPALIQNEKFAALQNARFVKGSGGGIQKRNGYQTIGTLSSGEIQDIDGNKILNGYSLATMLTELEMFGAYDPTSTFGARPSMFSYSADKTAWVNRGPVLGHAVIETQIVDNSYIQSNMDSCTDATGAVTVYAWEDTRGGVWMKVIDEASQSILLADTQLESTSTTPRVFQNAGFVSVMVMTSAGALKYFNVSTSSPDSTPSLTTLQSSLMANGAFDVYTASGNPSLLGYVNSAGHPVLYNLSTLSGTISLGNTSTFSGFGSCTFLSLTLAGSKAVLACASGGFVACYQATASNVSTGTSSGTSVAIGGVEQLLCYPYNSNAIILIQIPASGGTDRLIHNYGVTLGSGTLVDNGTVARGVGLCSRVIAISGFHFGSAATAVLGIISFNSTVQPTYYLVDFATFTVLGRYYVYNAGPFPSHSRLPSWNQLSSTGLGTWSVALNPASVTLSGINSSVQKLFGVAELVVDLTQTNPRPAQLGANISVGASMPQIYDGTNLFENGFNYYPERPTAAVVSSSPWIGNIVYQATFPAANSNTVQSFTLTMPVNPDGSGHDGAMITSGDWLFAGAAKWFWWDVDGKNTSAPSLTSGIGAGNFLSIKISSQWTASQVATAAAAAFTAYGALSTLYSIASSTNVVTFTAQASQHPAPPYQRTQPTGNQHTIGATGTDGITYFPILPGFATQPSQYWSFQSINGSAAIQNNYIWFIVDGIGSDPAPAANWVGCSVSILSTDSEAAVLTKVNAAITAAASSLFVTSITSSNPTIQITNSNTGPTSTAGQYPPMVNTYGQNSIGPSSLQIGQSSQYQYVAVYEYVDNQGQLHRSAPSVPVTITLGGSYNQMVLITVPTYRLTSNSLVDIAIYRTTNNGTNFQRVTNPLSLLYNSTSSDSVTFYDRTGDAGLASAEFLYTTGGVPQNDPAPFCAGMISHLGRLWAYSCENPSLIYYSKFWVPNVAVEWSQQQTFQIDQQAGKILKLVSMDNNLIIFCANQIWLISGSGPSSTGQGATFSQPQQVAATTGIRDPQSTALITTGVMFKSPKGIMLLDRSLQISYIGLPVSAYNADVVIAALAVPNTTEVRFLSSAASVLVYDYQFDQWGTFVNHNGNDAVVWGGLYTYISLNAAHPSIWQENPGVYSDAGAQFNMLITTAWIKLAQIQAYQRIWKALFKGSFNVGGGVSLQVSCATDYGGVIDTQTFGSGAINQIRYDPLNQLCQSMQLTIQDTASNPGRTWSLDAIDLEIGVRKGANKVPQAQHLG